MTTPLKLSQDFNGLQLLKARFEILSSAPTQIGENNRSPLKGDVYFDTTSNSLGVYNGTSWAYMGEGAIAAIIAGTAIDVDATDPANPIISVIIADLIDDLSSTTSNIYSASKVDSQIAAAIVGGAKLKGELDCSTNPNYPAALVGDFYIVSAAGKIGGASGINVEINDTVYCKNDTAGGNQATAGADFFIVQANIDGAVTGPASAVSGHLASFNGTSGKIIQDSSVAVSTDGTLASNSDTNLPTEKAIKTYADTKVAANSAITGATKTKITFDSKGLVTAGDDATTADIADSSDKRYVTDADLTKLGNLSGTNTGDQTISIVGDITAAGSSGELNASIGENKVLYSHIKRYAFSFLIEDFTSGSIDITAATHGLGIGQYNCKVIDASGNELTAGLHYDFVTNLANGEITISTTIGYEFNGYAVITRIN